jgi:peptidoglycan/LPS O-acetylase OafA/YrhL
MQSANTPYLEKLDHLRAAAAIIVMLFHTQLAVWKTSTVHDPFRIILIDQGHIGVPLFMVISGFILSHIVARNKIELKQFYLNRILRIYPLLIVAVALSSFAAPTPGNVSRAAMFLVGLLPLSGYYPVYSSPLWSVYVELQFYLVFPMLHAMLERYRGRAYLLLFAFLIALRLLIRLSAGTVHQFAFFSIFGGLDAFLFGCLASELFERYRDRTLPAWAPAAALLTVTLVMDGIFSNPAFFHVDYRPGFDLYSTSDSLLWVIWPTIQGALFAGLLLSYLMADLRIWASRQIAWVGTISYSFYAWHALVVSAFAPRFATYLSPYLIGVLVVLPISLAVAAMSYYVIEFPFLSLRRRYVSTSRPATESAKLKETALT